MKATIICIILVLWTPAHGAETSPNHRLALLSRVTCPAVREAVKLYGEAAAEQWARAHGVRSEEHTSELQSPDHLVCRLLLEKKKTMMRRRVLCRSATLPAQL